MLVGCGPSFPDITIDSAAQRNFEAVKQPLAAGTDVNTKNSSGITTLDCVTIVERKGIVKLLISVEGVDLNAKGKDMGLH